MSKDSKYFRWLLVISGIVAAIAFIAPVAAYKLVDINFADSVMRRSGWPIIICFVLLIVGVSQDRLRGLWLVIPLAISLFWPVYLGISFGMAISDCQKTHP